MEKLRVLVRYFAQDLNVVVVIVLVVKGSRRRRIGERRRRRLLLLVSLLSDDLRHVRAAAAVTATAALEIRNGHDVVVVVAVTPWEVADLSAFPNFLSRNSKQR